MSIKLMTAIWDNDDPDLAGSRLNILLCLADHANDDGVCWPSIARIAKRSRIDRSNVMDHIKKLIEAGYVKVERRSGTSSVYHVSPKPTSGGGTTSGADTTPTSGGGTTTPVAVAPPKPSVNHQIESSTTATASLVAAQDELALVPPNDSTPASPRTEKKAAKKTKSTALAPDAKNYHREMFAALAALCKVDTNIKRGQLNAAAKALLGAGYKPDDLDKFSKWWYSQDFRGQQGKPPAIGLVGELILQAVQWVPWVPPAPGQPQKKVYDMATLLQWHRQYWYEQWIERMAAERGVNPFAPGAFDEWYDTGPAVSNDQLPGWYEWWINRNKESGA